MARPIWQWDESIQRGTDYASAAEVRAYDQRMAALRDVSAESERILALLELSPDDVLLEVGTGTGAFARAAARRCATVIALDVSPTMLAYAAQRTREEQVDNVAFREAGFLTYEHQGEPLAAVVSQLALHHLPDPWKLLGLRRLGSFMRPGGRLFLTDVVLPDVAADDPDAYFAELIARMPEDFGGHMARHFSGEFSTFDWAMREILRRAGFVIEEADRSDAFLTRYLCRRA